ncbi:MAG: hypothetical protein ACREBN_01795 [Burkholderiaceae bacterium]
MAAKKPPATRGPQTLSVRLIPTIDTPSYYANSFEVSHTNHEFGIAVGRVPTRLPQAAIAEAVKNGHLEHVPEFMLVVPPTVIPAFIKALQDQYARYEKKMQAAGKPKEIKQ